MSSGDSGRYTQLVSYTKHLTDLHEKLINVYLKKCSCSREKLEDLLKNDTWLTAEEALELNLIDEIVG